MLLLLVLILVPQPQVKPSRTIPCRIEQLLNVSDEARLVINDPVLIVAQCRPNEWLYIPGHQWPHALGSPDEGLKFRLVVDRKGKRLGLKVGKRVVAVQTTVPRVVL